MYLLSTAIALLIVVLRAVMGATSPFALVVAVELRRAMCRGRCIAYAAWGSPPWRIALPCGATFQNCSG